jgi:hypothetical protein
MSTRPAENDPVVTMRPVVPGRMVHLGKIVALRRLCCRRFAT